MIYKKRPKLLPNLPKSAQNIYQIYPKAPKKITKFTQKRPKICQIYPKRPFYFQKWHYAKIIYTDFHSHHFSLAEKLLSKPVGCFQLWQMCNYLDDVPTTTARVVCIDSYITEFKIVKFWTKSVWPDVRL